MLCEIFILGIDLLVVGSLIKLYQRTQTNLQELKKAPTLNVDSGLYNALKENGGSLPYAVVSGSVRSKNNLIPSIYVPSLYGVIQEVVVKEHKTQWSPWSRFWCDVENELKKSLETVPFYLTDSGGGYWWRGTQVEVLDVGKVGAGELPLSVVYDHFTPCTDTLGSFLVSWVRGERCRGIQEVERMLTEGTLVTGIGELLLVNKEIRLQAPSNEGLSYFLTTLTPQEIVLKLEREALSIKTYAIIFSCLGLFVASWCVVTWHRKKKKALEKKELLRRLNEARLMRRQNQEEARERGEAPQTSTHPLCVVCLNNPVELLVLECGHACLCLECGENIQDTCPMCRSPILRTVPAFLP